MDCGLCSLVSGRFVKLRQKVAVLFAFVLFLALPAGIKAEEISFVQGDCTNAAAMRLGFYIVHTPVDNLSLTISEDLRMRDNFEKFDLSLSTIDLTYNVNPYFKFGAGYSFLAMYMNGNAASSYSTYWSLRHRMLAHVTGSVTAGDFKFALREQLRCTWNTDQYNDPRAIPNPRIELRSRFRVDYDTKKPVSPYIHVEMYNPINRSEYAKDSWINKMEYCAGFKWKISKRNSIDVFYMLSQSLGKSVRINDETASVRITQQHKIDHILAVFYYYRF